jgi:uncharacterized membrane protein YidH (DUF202 family)
MSHEHAGPAGLQVERTSLAWVRTALAASIVALIVTRYGVVRHEALLTASGVLLLVSAASIGVGAHRRQAAIERGIQDGRSPMNLMAMRLMTLVVIAAGISSISAILTLR